jgi:hypothetical protein
MALLKRSCLAALAFGESDAQYEIVQQQSELEHCSALQSLDVRWAFCSRCATDELRKRERALWCLSKTK